MKGRRYCSMMGSRSRSSMTVMRRGHTSHRLTRRLPPDGWAAPEAGRMLGVVGESETYQRHLVLSNLHETLTVGLSVWSVPVLPVDQVPV